MHIYYEVICHTDKQNIIKYIDTKYIRFFMGIKEIQRIFITNIFWRFCKHNVDKYTNKYKVLYKEKLKKKDNFILKLIVFE